MMQCHALITRVYFIIYQDIHIYQYVTIKVPALRLLVRLLQGFLLLCWPLLALRLLLRLLHRCWWWLHHWLCGLQKKWLWCWQCQRSV